MTDTHAPTGRRDTDEAAAVDRARLDGLAARAGLALAWERAWPPLAALASLAALFVATSWAGLWLELPRWGRIVGVLAFALAALAILWRARGLRAPARGERLERLDRDSGRPHHPATTLEDELSNAGADPTTAALWALHRRRAAADLDRLKVAAPSPRLVDRDKFALRAAALVALVAAAFVAGPQKYARLAAAFDWRSAGALAAGYRLDAWIDPPAYTGRPPLILPTKPGEDGSAAFAATTARRIEAPVGSMVVVRSSGESGVEILAEGALAAPDAEKTQARVGVAAPKPAAPAADAEARYVLKGDSRLILKRGGQTLAAFDISAIPDRAPKISLVGRPKPNVRGSLTLNYRIDDDYAVTGAEARFAKPIIGGKPATGRALVEPPRMTLALPGAPGGLGEGETTSDLAEHPWAGAKVTMTLSARDEAGNEGLSEPTEITLPARVFTKPMAKALVEQRRTLILSPDEGSGRVAQALSALMVAPDLFDVEPSVFLGLRTAATRLKAARADPQLMEVADFLWEMALRIEDGDVSAAERDLRAAQQALREAMQRNASPEEIKKLMDELRAAMDKFLREYAEQQLRDQRDNPNAGRDQNRNERMLSQRDLNEMLNRMEEMARRGDMADAQRMLDQMQRMMENLKSARRERQRDPQSREMSRQMGELDRMMREQQRLRDDTFREQRRDRRGQRPQRGQRGQQQNPLDDQDMDQGDQGADQDMAEGGDEQMSDEQLRERQKQLRERLEEMKRRMKQFGMNGEKGLDDAEEAMREAERELGEGQQGQQGRPRPGEGPQGGQQSGRNRGRAVDAQGRALEGLQRGMQGLAQQMQRQPGQQGGEFAEGDDWGEPDPNGEPRRADGQRDPLDRPRRDERNRLNDYSGLNAEGGAAERARRVLEELRRRLGDPGRPREELDYLERLLRRY
ncbi:MAG: TIGR02302 family protein [Rhizobiales bacterium]|nr:TIGR02302 family protein [Hyphomicrobiales bacterium]